MTDRTTNEIIDQLKKAHPDVKIETVTQGLSTDDFSKQKDKHLSHGGQGGVIGIILTPEDKIVLAHRSKLHSGWSLPGGTVEKDEAFEETFKREIEEEVGVKISSAHLVMIEKKRFVSPSQEELYFVLATYFARIEEKSLPSPTSEALLEGLKIKLFAPEKLPQDMIFEDKKKVEMFGRCPAKAFVINI